MNLWLPLQKAISLFPNKEAVVDGNKRFTYGEFGERIGKITHLLKSLGLKKGHVAAIGAPNCHEYMEIYFACAISGIVLVPLNYRLAGQEIRSILEDSECRLLFIHPDFAQQSEKWLSPATDVNIVVWLSNTIQPAPVNKNLSLEKVILNESPQLAPLADLAATDLANLYYTSGTTGLPKGVMLTHGNVTFNALGAVGELSLTDLDTWLHVAPMFHLADAWSIFAITWAGGKHVILPSFHAKKTLSSLAEEKVTGTMLVPTMLNSCLSDNLLEKLDFSSLRLIMTAGAPIAPEKVRQAVASFGCNYIQLYGLTETSPFLTLSIPKGEHQKLDEEQLLAIKCKTGRPFAGTEVRVVREDGSDVAADNNEVGEIIARGANVFQGYWKQPEATANTLKNGWIHTGDLAVIDEHGYINIVDRQKDMIITGGENVYSTEVEYALYELAAILECAVFGIPDPQWGESVKAAVVLRPGHSASEEEIITHLRSRLAHYKAPRSIDFLESLPKTGSGKIQKKILRDQYWLNLAKRVN